MSKQPIPTAQMQAPGARIKITHNCEYCDLEVRSIDGAHIHSCYEIYVHLSGDVSFLHGGELYSIEQGDVIFSRPGEVHCCVYHSSCLHEHACIWFDAEDAALPAYLERLAITPHVRLPEAERDELWRLVRLLADPATDPVLQAAYFAELLYCLRTRIERRDLPTRVREGKTPEKVREVLSYIEEHCLQRITSGQVASACYLSESTLNRLLRQHVGLSPARLIEAKRLSHAEGLLRADASVTDACFQSGFSDCSRFIACFRRQFGMTPLQYKKTVFK